MTMELEAVGAVPMRRVPREVLGQVDNVNCVEGAFLHADTAADAERFREVGDFGPLSVDASTGRESRRLLRRRLQVGIRIAAPSPSSSTPSPSHAVTIAAREVVVQQRRCRSEGRSGTDRQRRTVSLDTLIERRACQRIERRHDGRDGEAAQEADRRRPFLLVNCFPRRSQVNQRRRCDRPK